MHAVWRTEDYAVRGSWVLRYETFMGLRCVPFMGPTLCDAQGSTLCEVEGVYDA